MIHPTAIVHAQVGEDVWIGPYAVLGQPGEIRGEWRGAGQVVIGARTIIREHVVVQGPASVGEDCYLMHGVHIPHDATIGNNVTMSPYASIGGHCTVGDDATIGMGAIVHQRLHIGTGAMIGMGAVVTRNVPAFRLWYGNPARDHGWNPRMLREADPAVTGLDDE